MFGYCLNSLFFLSKVLFTNDEEGSQFRLISCRRPIIRRDPRKDGIYLVR